jgi:23S rRNA (pseudouridine1915-N3)-methyltransferase
VKIVLAYISAARARPKSDPAAAIVADYCSRASRYLPCELQHHDSEAALLTWLDRQSNRTAPILILLDSHGKQLTSNEFAAHLERIRDAGAQSVVLAVGPASGWTSTALARASLILSFGRITLPHELAQAVLAEQVYRALTILAGHPYHSGH